MNPLTPEDTYDVIVVGGGPAGLAAALSARDAGAKRVLLLERNDTLGGILNQCIHNGFGLHYFKEELTGPEYAERFIRQLDGSGVEVLAGTMVLEIAPDKTVYAINPTRGYMQLRGRAIVLAMGCRERTRGAIGIPGSRPAGVFTAGAAQLYMNIEGYQIGKKAVILGSGDIGLIMARRLTLEGAEVAGVFELMPYSGGLTRNIVQCLDDYGIPLHLSHTITEIRGEKRVEAVVVHQVDENRMPVAGTGQVIECDTVLLSVGLIPENELSRGAGLAIDPRTSGPKVFENMETSVPGVFACGNVAHVHDLVDFVTAESQRAGHAAGVYAMADAVEAGANARGRQARASGAQADAENMAGNTAPPVAALPVQAGAGVGYTVPQAIRPGAVQKAVDVFFRVSRVYTGAAVVVQNEAGETVARFKRPHMAPGEMEKISLPRTLLDKAGDGLTVAIEDGEAKTA